MNRREIAIVTALMSAMVLGFRPAHAEQSPTALIVAAHPDDDAAFAGTVYRITHGLQGQVDLAVITDGAGGFRYATLAEPIYGLPLTDESVGRAYLPAIRKREVMAGGRIVGIRNYFFLDEPDRGYTRDADSVLRHVWDTTSVKRRLVEIMAAGAYDFVFALLPTAAQHGHHKSAAILALEAARRLPEGRRPIVLGGFPFPKDSTPANFTGLPSHPITRVTSGAPLAAFDLTQSVGYNGRLNYKIIVNWVIAEHKSQGTMQLLVNLGDAEHYWYFDANGPEGRERVRALFARLTESTDRARQ